MKTVFYFMAAFLFLVFLFPTTLQDVQTNPQETTFPEYIAGFAIQPVTEQLNATELAEQNDDIIVVYPYEP